jgi:hypothetical protein
MADFNEVNGITSTQQFLENVLEIESPQQGAPVGNATNPFSGGGGVAASQVAVFRFE